MEKFNELKQKAFEFIKQKYAELDLKFSSFMPNAKLRKITFIALGSMISLFFIIIILGLTLGGGRSVNENLGTILQKPVIVSESPKPQTELTENQKEISSLKEEIDKLVFPATILNIPQIGLDIAI